MTNPKTRASLIMRLADPADNASWGEFLEIYEPMLMQLASRWGLQDADAREVVQETLVAVVDSISSYQPRDHGKAFRGWLASITRHKLADHLSLRATREQGSGDTDVQRWLNEQVSDDSPESIWDWHERRQVFQWAADAVRPAVTERTWQAFYRTSVLDESVANVAKELELREGMVYVGRSRVMSRLRKAVESWLRQREGDE